jgi:hypothetical protein
MKGGQWAASDLTAMRSELPNFREKLGDVLSRCSDEVQIIGRACAWTLGGCQGDVHVRRILIVTDSDEVIAASVVTTLDESLPRAG